MDAAPSDSPSVTNVARLRADPRWAVALLCVLGLGLRFWGLTWSLPNREHFYSYHPDEILVLSASQVADVWSGQLNPRFYNYGSFTIYLISLLRPLAYVLLAPSLYTDYLLGRTLTALLGAGTILWTYGLARRVGGERAGLIAAGFMAIAPEHVIHSHYVTVDVPATFWVAACLYASVRAFQERETRWALLAGCAAGLAAGTKYNAGLVLLSAIVAQLPRIKPILLSIGAFLPAFLLSTPGILLWPAEFRRDFSYEVVHTRTGHGLVFVGTAPGWIFHWTTNLLWGLGAPLLVLATLALLTALFRLSRAARDGAPESGVVRPYLAMLAFLAPYYLVIGAAEVKFLRYTIPLLPGLFALLGVECSLILGGWRWAATGFRRRSAMPPAASSGGPSEESPSEESPDEIPDRGTARYTAFGVAAAMWAVAIFSILYTVSFDGLFSVVPPQDQAGAWLRTHAAGRTVGLTTVPWFYSPPVSPYNAGPQSQRAFEAHQSESPYRLIVLGNDLGPSADVLKIARPEYVVLSQFETMDGLRLMHDPRNASRADVQAFARFMDAVMRDYSPDCVVWNRPSPLPQSLLPGSEPPHDWLYPYPSITIWARRR